MSYGISSRDYVARAKKCLEANDLPSLFYAALELRSGIESRLQEYLEVHEHISDAAKKEWRIGKLAKHISSAFNLKDQIAVLRFRDLVTNKIIHEARYTPVKESLIQKGKRLGDYLHCAKKLYPPEDAFWQTFRALAEEAIVELEESNRGSMLGPFLLNKLTGKGSVNIEHFDGWDLEFKESMKTNGQVVIEVDYE